MTSVVSSTAQDGGRAAGAAALQRQLQEFTQGTQLELERRLRVSKCGEGRSEGRVRGE